MLPMCADMGVGCAPYSPQGEGRLSRFWGTQIDRSGVDVRWLRLGPPLRTLYIAR
jgi:aryl-alcohol dehydrogenase-like predicted oxidoreductase